MDNLYFGGWKWYRKWRGGNWKCVGPKYCPEGCWIRNEEPNLFEVIWKIEEYD